jgi:hypothetical protein
MGETATVMLRALGKLGFLFYRPVRPVSELTRRREERRIWRSMYHGYLFVKSNGQSWDALRALGCELLKTRIDDEVVLATVSNEEIAVVRKIERSERNKPIGESKLAKGDRVLLQRGLSSSCVGRSMAGMVGA